MAWAIAWLLFRGNLAIRLAWSEPLERLGALLVVVAAVLAMAEYAGTRLSWWKLRAASLAHVPLMAGIAIAWFLDANGARHPLESAGAFAWPLAFAVHFHLVHRQRRDEVLPWPVSTYLGAWILLAVLATWEASWRWIHGENFWV